VIQEIPTEIGILGIYYVVLEGLAHSHLELGDLLIRVNGEIVTQFFKLEIVLENNGKTINLEVERSGVPLNLTLEVQDLHSITPNYLLEVSGGVIDILSYQQQKKFCFKCGLLYVVKIRFMLSKAVVLCHAII